METDLNDGNFKQEVLEENLPVLVDFWAVWCGPCLRLAPIVGQIAKAYKGKLKVCKLNVDDSPKTASSYGIISIPTLTIFRNGEVAHKIVGALSKTELEAAIKPYIGP